MSVKEIIEIHDMKRDLIIAQYTTEYARSPESEKDNILTMWEKRINDLNSETIRNIKNAIK